MKYGFNDYKWNENMEHWDKVCEAITLFNLDGFIPFMKRKTYDEKDEHMIKCAKEMIEMMEKHLEEIKNKG